MRRRGLGCREKSYEWPLSTFMLVWSSVGSKRGPCTNLYWKAESSKVPKAEWLLLRVEVCRESTGQGVPAICQEPQLPLRLHRRSQAAGFQKQAAVGHLSTLCHPTEFRQKFVGRFCVISVKLQYIASKWFRELQLQLAWGVTWLRLKWVCMEMQE